MKSLISMTIGFTVGCVYSIVMFKYMKKKDLEITIQEMTAIKERNQ